MADEFFADLREKHDVDDAIFLVDGAVPLRRGCRKHSLDSRYEPHGNWNSTKYIIYEVINKISIFILF